MSDLRDPISPLRRSSYGLPSSISPTANWTRPIGPAAGQYAKWSITWLTHK